MKWIANTIPAAVSSSDMNAGLRNECLRLKRKQKSKMLF